MKYLSWDEKTITDLSENNISAMYEHGYLFTRIGKGVMQQTRSVRIDLSKFKLTSENRRILKKVGDLKLDVAGLPLKDYKWSLGKLAKDFYEEKFGEGIMSAAKIKEILTDGAKSNFNCLFNYSIANKNIGYSVVYSNKSLIHYSYPFYELVAAPKDIGLGMMIQAVQYAKESGKNYIYLGSLQRPADVYKLQFEGLEWFDGNRWQTDISTAKEILKNTSLNE